MIQQIYQTPEGMVDAPFIYVFDGRGLTNGQSPNSLVVGIQDVDFILRSVVGVNQVAGGWRYYNASGEEAMSGIVDSSARWTVTPEKFYPRKSQIRFDLDTVAMAVNSDAENVALIGFQGVKRQAVGQQGWTNYESQYEYYEAPYAYQQTVNLDYFSDVTANPRKFHIKIDDYDFELQKIVISETTGGAPVVLPVDPFLIQLFDPSNYNELSTLPVSPRWLNFTQGGNFFSTFPVPTMVYPLKTIMRFDITSLILAAGGARTFQVSFEGVQRKPCGAPQ